MTLSQFKDETIATKLKDKIRDSSVTVVLISPKMKAYKPENDQWIPWEISYSLKEIEKEGRTSKSNGILAVVLPSQQGSLDYYFKDYQCYQCGQIVRGCNFSRTFEIVRVNMFNKHQYSSRCRGIMTLRIHT